MARAGPPGKRSKPFVILGLRVGQGQCAHRPAMEGAVEADHMRALRRVPHQLECALHGLCPPSWTRTRAWDRHRSHIAQRAAHLGIDREIEVGRRVVQDLGSLPLHASTTLGCACPVEFTAIPALKSRKTFAVDVLDAGPAAALRDERVGAWQGRAGDRVVAGQDFTCAGPDRAVLMSGEVGYASCVAVRFIRSFLRLGATARSPRPASAGPRPAMRPTGTSWWRPAQAVARSSPRPRIRSRETAGSTRRRAG
jgi:hypothetical protein